MATDNKITIQENLIAQSVNFTTGFKNNLNTLLKVLGVTRRQALTVGNQVKIYKTTKELEDGSVPEGEQIPLSRFKRELDRTITLDYKKYRKEVTAEAIQGSGFEAAVTDTDAELLDSNQAGIKKDFFDLITGLENATKNTVTGGFQKALASALGQLAVKFEDKDANSVLFVNPLDFYEYLGENQIQVQTAFGLKYVQNYLGFDVIVMSANVKQGTVVATASQNLNVAYAAIDSQLKSAFDLTTDTTGFIGIGHTPKSDNLSYDTVTVSALKMFPDIAEGVIQTTFSKN